MHIVRFRPQSASKEPPRLGRFSCTPTESARVSPTNASQGKRLELSLELCHNYQHNSGHLDALAKPLPKSPTQLLYQKPVALAAPLPHSPPPGSASDSTCSQTLTVQPRTTAHGTKVPQLKLMYDRSLDSSSLSSAFNLWA